MTGIFGLRHPPLTRESDTLWDQARALVRRGPPFVPSEAAALSAAHPHGLERPMQDGLDVLVMVTCGRFPRPHHDAAPEDPSPFDAAIAAAEEALEAVRVRELAARDACHRLQDRARACAQRTTLWEAVMAELDGALEAHRAVDQEWLRAKARLGSLAESRARWRMEQDS